MISFTFLATGISFFEIIHGVADDVKVKCPLAVSRSLIRDFHMHVEIGTVMQTGAYRAFCYFFSQRYAIFR